MLTLYNGGDIIAPETRKEDKEMVGYSAQDAFTLSYYEYEKYSNKMLNEGKKPVSFLKFAFGQY